MATMAERFLPMPTLTGDALYRFWSNVKVQGKCLEWQKARYKSGYGRINIGGQSYIVSRVAYTIHFGKDPFPLMVCHECNNPPCVRREHLFLGTTSENQIHRSDCGRNNQDGELNPNAKLRESDVREILSLLPTVGRAELARRKNVSVGTIHQIARREIWRSL